ncbi:MAG: hypothetical protein ACOC8E_03780 [Planctomycetota bacterium]
METIEMLGQPNCLKLSNGTVEVIVTTGVGPRIVGYAFAGGENILGLCPDESVSTALGEWKPWGGHRLWAAPESMPRSYVPDNEPIEAESIDDLSVRLTPPVEESTGIRKEITVGLDDAGSRVTVEHRITNHALWPLELAPWAITILNASEGGTVILPQEPYVPHDDALLPARSMALWHYTDLGDPRWDFGRRFLRLTVDPEMAGPQKIGMANHQGWAAYVHGSTVFVKHFEHDPEAVYPDEGCNCEAYTAGAFVELETLGPMHRLEPGEWAVHVERWALFENVDIGATEEEIAEALEPLVEEGPA